MSEAETLTALEKKWNEEKEEKGPELADSYADSGVLDPKALHEKVRERVPQPTGWRITVLPYMGREKSKGGIALPEQTRQLNQLTTSCGYVLKMGDLAYADQSKFPKGPWCKEGDFVLTRPYAGTRVVIHGREFRIINDDTVEAVVEDPRGIRRA